MSPRLQCANTCGAHGQDAPAPLLAILDGLQSALGDVITLKMHVVVFDACGLHGLKGARTHVQSDFSTGNPRSPQCDQDRLIKMQGGGGRGHRPWVLRKDGLVALLVGSLIISGDVGWERNMARLGHDLHGVARESKAPQRTILVGVAREQGGTCTTVQEQGGADQGFFAHSQMHHHLVRMLGRA